VLKRRALDIFSPTMLKLERKTFDWPSFVALVGWVALFGQFTLRRLPAPADCCIARFGVFLGSQSTLMHHELLGVSNSLSLSGEVGRHLPE
jgi:hypothetical protein